MKNKKRKKNIAVDCINLAKNIKDKDKRNICIGSIFALTHKFLSENEINSILKVIKLTDLDVEVIKQLKIDSSKIVK